MFETYLGEKFFALLFLFPNVAVFFVQKKLIISIGTIVFGIQVFLASLILFPNSLTTFIEISNW